MRVLIVLLCITMYSNVFGALFGVSPKLFNKTVNQLENVDTNLQAGINDNKLEIKDIKLKVQANAQVGVGNSVNRDVTNDTGLMKKIIAGLIAVITALIGIVSMTVTKLFALINHRNNLQEEKRKYQKELNELRNKGVIP